jgi:hypothetical protein
MFGIDDLAEGVIAGAIWGTGLVAGGAVASVALPQTRPVAKRVLKGYLALTHKAKSMAADAVEHAQDLYAEAKHEFQSELASAGEAEAAASTAAAETAGAATGSPRRGRHEAQEQPA